MQLQHIQLCCLRCLYQVIYGFVYKYAYTFDIRMQFLSQSYS